MIRNGNANGLLLVLELCSENDLTVTKTLFPVSIRHKTPKVKTLVYSGFRVEKHPRQERREDIQDISRP